MIFLCMTDPERNMTEKKNTLIALPTRSRECILKLSHSKMQIHPEEPNCFGHTAEREGIRFDSK